MHNNNKIDERIQFAGLTTHNNASISDRAADIAGLDSDDPPATSLTSAIRMLEDAESGSLAWKVPDTVAGNLDVQQFEDGLPDSATVTHTPDGSVFVETNRFQSLYSPDKLEEYIQHQQQTAKVEAGDVSHQDVDMDFVGQDPLWHVPTKNYSIINPIDAYQPLEQAIRDEDLGDEVFGEIRTYKGGGEVHMDILFDNYQIQYTEDDEGSDPIVLGIRTGYSFFGDTALYFEGFGQDTRCDNSIRAITDEKVFRHVGEDLDLQEEIEDILGDLGVMTSRLAELIELAQDIEIELLDLNFAEVFDHSDNLRAFYELSGFPSYLAREAAQHARHRSDNRFMPNMTDVWDGATYALSHHYRGGENTARANELIEAANDFVYNPSLVIGEVDHEFDRRVGQMEGDQADLDGETATAKVTEFSESVRDLEEEFESRNEELRTTLLAEVDADGDGDDGAEVATDGGGSE